MMTVGELIDKNPNPDTTICVSDSTRVMDVVIYQREFGFEYINPRRKDYRDLVPKEILVFRFPKGSFVIEAKV